MRRPRTSPTEMIKHAASAIAVLVVAPILLALTAQPAAAAPPYTLEERAAAITTPSLVFLEFRLEGYVRYRASGELVEPSKIALYSRCSGFVVNADGYVVTTSHCLDPQLLRAAAASIVANDLIAANKLTLDQRSAFVAHVQQTADFTGATASDKPVLQANAQLFTATTGADDTKTIGVTVVDSQAAADGETTLVKLDQTGLPAVELGNAPLQASTRVVMVGFGANDATTPKVTYTPRSQAATIVGDFGKGTPPLFQLDGDLGRYSTGGMVTDTDGKVVGMITSDVATGDQANKIVTPTSTIQNLLNANQIKNTLGPMDRTYRDGLNAYFGGHYTDAIKKLDSVLAAMPGNTMAQTYRKQAADRLAVEGDPDAGKGTTTVILAVVAGVAVLALMVGAVFVVIRGRRREREFTYFDPYASPNPYPTSSPPVSAPTPGWPAAAPTSGWPAAPTSGVPPVAPVPVVPISAVPASPYAPPVSSPPDGFYHPPEPTTTYPVVVPVPPPTPMSVAPQYGQALPEPWAPPVGPVPVPGPAEPPTGTLYPQQTIPRTPVETPPEAPVTGPPAGPPVGAEPPTGQPWDVPDDERMFGSPPDAYRHRP